MAKLSFLGATQQVTGSCYLIEMQGRRMLLECGLQQGEHKKNNKNTNNKDFPFDPKEIDAVVLSHAHLDHSGRLPQLVAHGFNGPIYVTGPTHDLLHILLQDAAQLHFKDIEWENKRRQRAGKELLEPLYTIEDVDKALSLRQCIDYRTPSPVLPGLELVYHNAGHILGSAIVELRITEDGRTRKLVFSGDLGNSQSPLMPDPAILDSADILLLESTYGDRDHRSLDETLIEFREALDAADVSGGNVLIPAFAVGRTQDILYHLGRLYQAGKLKQRLVFLDSPMAIDVTDIYEKHANLFNRDDPEFRRLVKEGWNEWLPILRYTPSTEESMALNKVVGGAIIIAGSGMCNGGRILHHFKHNLWRNSTHLIITGYQAFGTLGRSIVDGAKEIRVFGNEIAVKANIHTLGGFSAHAGQKQLLRWAGAFRQPRPELYLIHGELKAMQELQRQFRANDQWEATIPEYGDSILI